MKCKLAWYHAKNQGSASWVSCGKFVVGHFYQSYMLA